MSGEGLVQISQARKALARVSTIDEAKGVADIADAAALWAKRAKAGTEAQNEAAEIALLAKRKGGELLAQVERGNTLSVQRRTDTGVSGAAKDAGISREDAHRWQRLASIDEDTFRDTIEDIKNPERGTELTLNTVLRKAAPHVSHNSGDSEWYTPGHIIEAARQAMGGIDLDPASSAVANETVRATTFYTAEDDGLQKEWWGRVWLNPPYEQPLVGQFVERLLDSPIEAACVLVNNATETRYGQALLKRCTFACFPKGRIRFLKPQGELGAPLQGQMLIGINVEPKPFLELGICLYS